jgi:uncharacterized pyridoxamine 5'-phosphate oxidase family protein
MDTQQERQLSTNWTGSYMENPLPGDFTYEWKDNEVIITGSFYEKTLPQYDGVFINKTKLLYCNENTAKVQIKNHIPNFTKIGSLVSWYNYLNSETNMFNIDDIEYQHIELEESPPSNYIYGSDKNYYVPKMKIT